MPVPLPNPVGQRSLTVSLGSLNLIGRSIVSLPHLKQFVLDTDSVYFFIQDRDYLLAMECIKGTGSVESTQHADTHAAGEQASCHILTSSPGNIALTFQERQRQPSGAVWNGGMSVISRHTHTHRQVWWIQGFEMATGLPSLHNHSNTHTHTYPPTHTH